MLCQSTSSYPSSALKGISTDWMGISTCVTGDAGPGALAGPERRNSTAKAGLTVLSCSGGAWTIGYKAWGSLLGRRLSKAKVLVYCLDYRNFPQVCACGAASADCRLWAEP